MIGIFQIFNPAKERKAPYGAAGARETASAEENRSQGCLSSKHDPTRTVPGRTEDPARADSLVMADPPEAQFEDAIQALVDMYREGDWDRLEQLAEGLMKLARRQKLAAAADAAGVVARERV